MTEDEEETVLAEEDDFTSLRGVEDDEAIFLLLLERRFPLEAGMTDEEEEDDTLSSFADVPLSPPQAARAMDRKIASRDCFAAFSMTLFKPTITLFIPNFLILNSFQLTKIFYQNIEKLAQQQTSSSSQRNVFTTMYRASTQHSPVLLPQSPRKGVTP
jgi:hypothetical protein